jgi:hypothetical protein
VFGVHVALTGDTHAIWVCRAHPGNDGIRVESIERLVDLPGGAESLDGAAEALVTKIAEAPRSAWGFDAPFGRAPEGRRTDGERGVAPAPAEATDWVANGVLDPLRSNAQVCVLPLQPAPLITEGMPPEMIARAASTYLLEVSPAALREQLRDEGVSPPAGDPDSRRAGLRSLAQAAQVRPMARALRERILDDGGLDALLCAVAAWRGYRGYDHGVLHAVPEYAQQGYIYC